jgi:hypothetical protein
MLCKVTLRWLRARFGFRVGFSKFAKKIIVEVSRLG